MNKLHKTQEEFGIKMTRTRNILGSILTWLTQQRELHIESSQRAIFKKLMIEGIGTYCPVEVFNALLIGKELSVSSVRREDSPIDLEIQYQFATIEWLLNNVEDEVCTLDVFGTVEELIAEGLFWNTRAEYVDFMKNAYTVEDMKDFENPIALIQSGFEGSSINAKDYNTVIDQVLAIIDADVKPTAEEKLKAASDEDDWGRVFTQMLLSVLGLVPDSVTEYIKNKKMTICYIVDNKTDKVINCTFVTETNGVYNTKTYEGDNGKTMDVVYKEYNDIYEEEGPLKNKSFAIHVARV